MNHEPECPWAPMPWADDPDNCICEKLRAAYQRGREDAAQAIAVLEPTQDYGFLRLWRDEAIVAARGGKADGSEFRSPIVWTRSNIVINVSGNASEADIRAAIAAASGDGAP